MFRKRWQKIICLLLAFLIAGTNMQGVKVYAVESSVSKGNITEEKPEDSDVIAAENEKGFDRTESSPEAGDRANSWRYKEGERILQKFRYIQYDTWPTNIDGTVAYGIDVSEHQGTIDWSKVKANGVDYAIVRCGYGQDYESQDDKYWKINADACVKYGIPFSTYLYSYADTVEKAKSEAKHVLRLIKGYDLSYPVYYDLEESSIRNKLTSTEIADVAQAFCDTIEAAGYEVAIYANTDWFTNYLTDSRFNQWDKWVAQYNTICTYAGKYSMWQCSSQGSVSGINGYVDLNIDLGAGLRSNGFYQAPDTQEWYYYKNGKPDTDCTDIIKGTVNGESAWWYVVNGKVTFTETVAKNNKGWWHIQNGKVNFNSNTVAKNSKGWWVIRNGKVDFAYTGFAENKNGWWYCKEGKVQFGVNDVIKGTVNGEYAWWLVTGGKVIFDETVAKNSKGWWVIRNGKVDFTYTGFAENKNGWWYCKEGKVQFGVNDVIKGTVKGESAWWYVVNGKVTFTETVAKNSKGWWHIQNGKVNFYSNTVAKNSKGWWVIRNGKVDFTFNGIAGNSKGKWVCQSGKVNFKYNGTYKEGNTVYKVSGGKVISKI